MLKVFTFYLNSTKKIDNNSLDSDKTDKGLNIVGNDQNNVPINPHKFPKTTFWNRPQSWKFEVLLFILNQLS